MDSSRNSAGFGFLLAVIVFVFFLLTIFLSFGTIGQGERGVHTRFQRVVGMKEPGLYFKLPFFDSVKKFNIKNQNVTYEREEPLAAASSDLQDVQIATVVNYHLEPSAVGEIYSQYGREEIFEEDIIRPKVRDTVKAVASQFSAEELVTRRPEFTAAVLSALIERLSGNYVVIDSVNITNFQFSPKFTEAIEAKVTAEQEALAAENRLEQVKFEAQQQIERAKAEAETIRIQAQAITQQGGQAYVELEAVKKWNGQLPIQMIPGAAVPFINLQR